MTYSRTIDLGGAVIECVVRGSGPAVLLLPGLGGDAGHFGGLGAALADAGYRSVAVNPRGTGRSRGPLEALTLHELAADVAGLIEALGAAPAFVLGMAFGNRVARCLAADRPELVRGLVLLAAGGAVAPEAEAQAALQRAFGTGIEEPARVEALRTALFSAASAADPTALSRLWPPGWATTPAALAQAAAGQATPVAHWWSGGTAPMLVVQGLDDRLAPPANGHALREQFGDRVLLAHIADAAHAMLFERPGAVAAAVLAFLRRPGP